MSNIPLARKLITMVLANTKDRSSRMILNQALGLMVRVQPCRRAARQQRPINAKMRRKVIALARDNDLTLHQIANMTGLRSSGRVSDVLHGKR